MNEWEAYPGPLRGTQQRRRALPSRSAEKRANNACIEEGRRGGKDETARVMTARLHGRRGTVRARVAPHELLVLGRSEAAWRTAAHQGDDPKPDWVAGNTKYVLLSAPFGGDETI